MISKVDFRAYLALSSIIPQLFGQSHRILRVTGDYPVDNYFPSRRAEFLVGLLNGYDSHPAQLVNHLVRIDSDANAAGKG